jgi:hypothetical protein
MYIDPPLAGANVPVALCRFVSPGPAPVPADFAITVVDAGDENSQPAPGVTMSIRSISGSLYVRLTFREVSPRHCRVRRSSVLAQRRAACHRERPAPTNSSHRTAASWPERAVRAREHDHTLKEIFKGAATTVVTQPHTCAPYAAYKHMTEAGTRPSLAKVTLARMITAIVLRKWKDGEPCRPRHTTQSKQSAPQP